MTKFISILLFCLCFGVRAQNQDYVNFLGQFEEIELPIKIDSSFVNFNESMNISTVKKYLSNDRNGIRLGLDSKLIPVGRFIIDFDGNIRDIIIIQITQEKTGLDYWYLMVYFNSNLESLKMIAVQDLNGIYNQSCTILDNKVITLNSKGNATFLYELFNDRFKFRKIYN